MAVFLVVAGRLSRAATMPSPVIGAAALSTKTHAKPPRLGVIGDIGLPASLGLARVGLSVAL